MPPCEFAAIRMRERVRKLAAQKKKQQIANKKKALLKALATFGFSLEIKTASPNQTLILGKPNPASGNRGRVEVLFDDRNGKFVVHCGNFNTHEEEHELVEKLVKELSAEGYLVEVNYKKERPVLPETEADQLPNKNRETEEGKQ